MTSAAAGLEHSQDKTDRLGALANEVVAKVSRRLQAVVASVTPTVPLTPAIEAERKTMRTHRGATLSYYEDRQAHGRGRPLVLVHGVNACASAYEMRPLFERYRTERPVYAVELPGFGFSERGNLAYSPEAYTAELVDFLARVKDKDGDAPDVVALSLGCELVARAAVARKDLVHSLALISPTGFDTGAHPIREGSIAARAVDPTHWWSPLLYQLLVSRPSIKYFLGKSFEGTVDADLRDYDYTTAHQPGAEYAPLAFLSGKLFTRDIHVTYSAVERPVLVIYDRDAYTGFDRLHEMVTNSANWTARRIAPTRGMPHFERFEETSTALRDFWTASSHDAHGHNHNHKHAHSHS